jgi:hypothetical protein
LAKTNPTPILEAENNPTLVSMIFICNRMLGCVLASSSFYIRTFIESDIDIITARSLSTSEDWLSCLNALASGSLALAIKRI